jgi:hypothetical protein
MNVNGKTLSTAAHVLHHSGVLDVIEQGVAKMNKRKKRTKRPRNPVDKRAPGNAVSS